MKRSKINQKFSKQGRRVKQFTIKFHGNMKRENMVKALNTKQVKNRLSYLIYSFRRKEGIFKSIISVNYLSDDGEIRTYSLHLNDLSSFTVATIRNEAQNLILNLQEILEQSRTSQSGSHYNFKKILSVNFSFVYLKGI